MDELQTDIGRETEGLELAMLEAQTQLKIMWNLRRRLHLMAQAAAIGACLGLGAAMAIGGYVAWQIKRTGYASQILADPDAYLLFEFGLLIIILLMSGYLWIRRLVARDSGAALEDEIRTVRSALLRATEVSSQASASEARE